MNSSLSIKLPSSVKTGWEDSNIAALANQSGQFKSKLGAEIVQTSLAEKGISCFITDNGNLNFGSKYVSEIRTAFASIQNNRKSFWFNQIRPKVENWTHLHLVCVHPEKVEIYEYTKEEILALCEDAAGLDHIGQEGDLLAVNVYQPINVYHSRKKGNYWKLECYGKKVSEFSTDKIQLVSNEAK